MSETMLGDLFADAMERLGPVERLALGVSGGADSLALAVLARDWAAPRRVPLLALVADHGLRHGSDEDMAATLARLAELGVPARGLSLGLAGGPGLQARARAARHAALAEAAREAGFPHLALGHHAADQAETVAMRRRRGTGGAEGMAAWTARRDVVLLRPLLEARPEDLAAYLRSRRMDWVEDPANADPRFERARLRAAGAGGRAEAGPRQLADIETAAFLARHAEFRPEGFVLLASETAPPAALAALLRTVGAADYPPPRAGVAALAAHLRTATLGGVQVARWRGFWLLAREPSACAAPVAAAAGVVWDRRFRLQGDAPAGAAFGALGADAARYRSRHLPALVRRGLPSLRLPGGAIIFPAPACLAPPAPATARPFVA